MTDNEENTLGQRHTEPAPNGSKILSFSGDVEDEDEGGDHDPPVDLFAEASKPDVEGEAEPEDDFNAAWEVLDLARSIYEKQMDGNDEMRLRVADTFIMLGDISLETGVSFRPPFDFTLRPEAETWTFDGFQRNSSRPSRIIVPASR